MKWLYKVERKIGKYAIPNIMLYICTTSLAVYILTYVVGFNAVSLIDLNRAQLFSGQLWRLVTFVLVPPATSLIWILFTLYFYYIIGKSLEDAWGTFQFNAYYVCGMLGTVLAALITGYGTPTELNLSLFLAYAAIFPDNEVLLFFILPIKIKYLAYLDWVLYAIRFIIGPNYVRVSTALALINFFLFFGPGMIRKIKDNQKYSAQRKQFRKAMDENRNNGGKGNWH